MRYFVSSKLSENMFETPEGFLVCLDVPIARTGVQEYHEKELQGTEIEGDRNGMIEIYRDEKEVFSPKTIKSFEGKPFTIQHPKDLVTPDNWSKLAKGVLQNVRRGKGEHKDDLMADILINDAEAIQLVKKGMREVSCGYEADYEQTETGKGEQSNIIGNHLALVDEGRAGEAYAIKDHKGAKKMNAFEKIFSVFAKDPEALKVMKAMTADSKKKKTADDDMVEDEMPSWASDMKECMDAMSATISNMAQPTTAAKDEDKEKEKAPPADKEKEKKANDADPMQKVMDALDAMGKRLDALEGKTGDDEEEVNDEEADTDDDEGEEMLDEDVDTDDQGAPDVVSGDSAIASRLEILAPGADIDTKDKSAKVKALKACFATKDGKKIIGALSGGKVPKWTDAKAMDMLFMSTSEVLKAKRVSANSRTKFADKELIDGTPESKVMTAEKMNEMNAKYYGKRAEH